MVQLGLFLFSPDQGADLFRFARDYVEGLPDECGVFLAGLSAPPEPFVPRGAALHARLRARRRRLRRRRRATRS